MTNKERYRSTFGALHASPDTVLEVTNMKQSKRKALRPLTGLAAAGAAAALLVGSAFAVNEATDGALAQRISIWLNGKEAETTLVSTGEGAYDVVADGETIGTVTEDEDSVAFNYDSDAEEGHIVMEWDDGSIEMEWSGTGGGSASASFGAGDGESQEETVTVTEGVTEADPEESEDGE
ncbi:MAG: hypothetical protein LUC87_07875 [Clostridiales bacterium]|nr:hypothetical protein [Clostridiales bacterium]